MSTKRVLVTGATGFIGKYIIPILLEKGYDIIAVYSGRSKHIKTSSHCEYIATNLLDIAGIENLIRNTKPSYLVHVAWEARPGIFWTSKDNMQWAKASSELFRSFYRNGGIRGISAGSCAQYEWGTDKPFIEMITPDKPATLYGQAKLAFEAEIMHLSIQQQLSYASGRIFMTYGPNEYPQKLIASIISALLQNQPINTTDGNMVRDFMYVKDIAAAFVSLLESDIQGIVNIASGQPTMIKDLIFNISEKLKKPDLIRLGSLSRQPNEPDIILADTSRLNKEVKFTPEYDIDTGINEYINISRSALDY
jgi:nucleoside-diphosphate-sugar epimerase